MIPDLLFQDDFELSRSNQLNENPYNIQNLCNISAGVLYSNPKCIRL